MRGTRASAQVLLDIETSTATPADIKSDLKDIVISTVKEVEVRDGTPHDSARVRTEKSWRVSRCGCSITHIPMSTQNRKLLHERQPPQPTGRSAWQ